MGRMKDLLMEQMERDSGSLGPYDSPLLEDVPASQLIAEELRFYVRELLNDDPAKLRELIKVIPTLKSVMWDSELKYVMTCLECGGSAGHDPRVCVIEQAKRDDLAIRGAAYYDLGWDDGK